MTAGWGCGGEPVLRAPATEVAGEKLAFVLHGTSVELACAQDLHSFEREVVGVHSRALIPAGVRVLASWLHHRQHAHGERQEHLQAHASTA